MSAIQDSSEDESSRSGGEEEEESGSSSGSDGSSSSDGSSGSSDDSDSQTEDELPPKKLPVKKAVLTSFKSTGPSADGKKVPKGGGAKAEAKAKKSAGGDGGEAKKSSGAIPGSPTSSERSRSVAGGDKKLKGASQTKDGAGGKKRPLTDENGPQKKKVKAGADGKPAVPKKSPGKAPGTGSSKKPPGPKKEKAAGGGGASTPKPPSKKKKKEGQGDEAGGTNEEKTPKPKKETPPKASATRRPAKKKRQISWDEEKDLRRVLKNEQKKRQAEAKAKVTLHFKRESKIAPFARTGGTGGKLSGDILSLPPPEPASSIIQGLTPEQGSRLVNSWSFLNAFARPLGLIHVPTLPDLTKALRTLDATEEGEAREKAEELWQEVCSTLVRAVAPEVEAVMGLRGTNQSQTFQDLFAKRTGLMLPFNCLTWPELARLCLLVTIFKELSFTDAHVAECIRGRWNFRKNRAFLKLLKLRMEARRMKPKIEAKPSAPEEADAAKSPDDEAAAPAKASTSPAPHRPAGSDALATPKQESGGAGALSAAAATAETNGAMAMDVVKEPLNGGLSTTPTASGADAAAMDVDTEVKGGEAGTAEGEKMKVEGEEEKPAAGKPRRPPSNDDDDEEEDEEEEEEGMAEEEVRMELEDMLASSDRTENEKRMAYLLKRLLAHNCSEFVGVDGTQSLEVASSLVDYPMAVWQPIRVSTLVTLLKDGVFSGPDGPELLARHANLMCKNSYATNIEDSEPWGAADRFIAIFERLLKKWILDPSRPPLTALHEEPCHICGKSIDRMAEKVTCSRCAALMHPYCLGPARSAAAEEGWCCSDCVNLPLKRQWYPTVRAEPSPSDIEGLMYEKLPKGLKRVVDVARTVFSDWGPTTSFPPILDLTVNRTVFEMVEEDSELAILISAVAILGTHETHKLEQRLILLDALCNLAANAPEVRKFLDTQEQKIVNLRRKMPEDEAVLRNELKTIGGDAAVLAWKDPMVEADNAADDEEEEGQSGVGVCVVCEKSTAGFDQSTVILCENCPTELHLHCLDAKLTEVPKEKWYCPRCRSKRNKRKARPAVKPEELEDPLAKERDAVETQLFNALMEENIQKIVEAREAGGAAAEGGVAALASLSSASSNEVCEYCGFTEQDIGSPLVLGQSREETEEHVKMLASAEAREGLFPDEDEKSAGRRRRRRSGDSLPPLVPYFPRRNSSLRSKLPSNVHYPVVHEKCAIQMLGLRAHSLKEREEGKCEQEEKLEKLIEDALRISGTRTFPLGEDRHGRCYWKMPGDDDRLFVWVRSPKSKQETVPGRNTDGHWLCYESRSDIEKLVHYLNERDETERVLKLSLVEEFLGEKTPPMPHYDESLVIKKPPEVPEGEEGTGAKMDVVKEGDGTAAAAAATADPAVTPMAVDDPAPAPPPQPAEKEGDATESEKEMEAGGESQEALEPVALKLIEAKCQVDLPPAILEIEVPMDLWGEELENFQPVKKSRKFYTLALVDAKDRLWEERTVSIKYEIFRGGDLLEESTALKAHKDFMFWFYAYEFKLPGIYTLRWSVITEPWSRQIRQFCVRTIVRGHRARGTYGHAINSLSFLNLTRGGRMTHRQAWELHIPEGADAVAALRIALLQLKESLPYGALVESEDDLANVNSGGSSSKSSGSGGGKGPLFVWNEALAEQWTNHLMEAQEPHEVMEDLILLENCLHPDWLKPWYSSLRRAYTTSHAHLLRTGTAAAVALHLFVLDKAILYDKEKVIPRAARSTRAANQKTARKGRPSYQEPSDEEFDDEDDEYEEEESESDGGDDDEDFTGARRSARVKKSAARKPAAPQRPRRAARDRAIKTYLDRDDDWDEEDEPEVKHELRQRPRVNYREVSGVDEQEDEDEEEEPRPKAAPATSWSCRRCTRDNELGATECASCGSPRPRDIAAAVAAISAAPSQNHASQPTPSSHLPPATVARADSPPTLESGDEAEFEDDQFVKQCKKIIRRLHDHEYGNLFVDEVTDEIAPGYSHIIKHPMCLRTLRQKLKSGKYQSSYAAFIKDAELIFSNAESYNGPEHDVTHMAQQLKAIFDAWASQHTK